MSVASVSGAVSFRARAEASEDASELLRSPASGAPCVYWRLRVVEEAGPRLHLVHDVASADAFELVPTAGERTGHPGGAGAGAGGAEDGARIRVAPDGARIEATPALHRPGSAGAEAAARALGLTGRISVEEITLRAGDEVTASGVLEDAGVGASPFRRVSLGLELFDATVRLPSRVGLASALVPLAIGTAAALLGSAGAAVWATWHYDLAPPGFEEPPLVLPAELGPQKLPQTRLP
jgi:hypothetical protein